MHHLTGFGPIWLFTKKSTASLWTAFEKEVFSLEILAERSLCAGLRLRPGHVERLMHDKLWIEQMGDYSEIKIGEAFVPPLWPQTWCHSICYGIKWMHRVNPYADLSCLMMRGKWTSVRIRVCLKHNFILAWRLSSVGSQWAEARSQPWAGHHLWDDS